MKKQSLLAGIGAAAAALGVYATTAAITRYWYVNWGATEAEIAGALPGDEFMDHTVANHAVTINAPVEEVWPWLVQVGQDKAGFYSYTWLENMVAADMHNADRIVPEWQQLKIGDKVRLASEKVYGNLPLLPVVALEKNHYLVLEGWGAFVLKPLDQHRTRMIIRSRAPKESLVKRAFNFLLFEPVHFVMERKMLLGIKERAEKAYQQKQASLA